MPPSEPLVFFCELRPDEVSPVDEEAINKFCQIHSLIRIFASTFTTKDSCILHLSVPNIEAPGLNFLDLVRSWVAEADIFFLKHAEIKLSYTTNALISLRKFFEDNSTQKIKRLDLEMTDCNTTSYLFSCYQEFKLGHMPAYDVRSVSDLYDPDLVMICSGLGVGRSSTGLNGFNGIPEYIFKRPQKVTSVLDVGCGAGYFLEILKRTTFFCKEKTPVYVGIDSSRNQILRAKSRFPSDFFKIETADSLSFCNNSFDLIIANSVLAFMPVEKQFSALLEMLRVSNYGFFASLQCDSDKLVLPIGHGYTKKLFGLDVETCFYLPSQQKVEQILDADCSVKYTVETFFEQYDATSGVTKIIGSNSNEYSKKLDEAYEEVEKSTIQSPTSQELGLNFGQYQKITIVPRDFDLSQPSFNSPQDFAAPIFY